MFLKIFYTVLPLLFFVLVGFIAGRRCALSVKDIGALILYVYAPFVSFGGIAKLELSIEYIVLPLVIFCVAVFCSLCGFYGARRLFQGNLSNLAGVMSVSGNIGFFGLPVLMAIAPKSLIGAYLMMSMGIQIAELTVGSYIGARGAYTARDSLRKLLKLPALHAVWLGLAVNLSGLSLGETFYQYWDFGVGGWITLGTMMIGIALADAPSLKPDIGFTAFTCAVRFLLWPALGGLIIFGDKALFQFFNHDAYMMLAVVSMVPLPAYSVALSAAFGLPTDKAAFGVLFSTLVATILAPAVLSIILKLI